MPLTRLFTEEIAVVKVATLYLWVVPLSYGMAGIIMIANASFNGLGKPLPATVLSITRMLIVYLPLAYIGKAIWGILGIFIATALSNLVVGTAASIWGLNSVRR